MDDAAKPATSGRPEKRAAIVRAATTVFGREGYERASMDAIAAEAGVSKRTVYNHFFDKEKLFLSVALDNSKELSEQVRALTEERLTDISDLRATLIDLAAERVRAVLTAGEHGALGRVIRAEAGKLPPDVLRAWEDVGPLDAQRDLAARFSHLADEGLLVVEDASLAAEHFTLLTFYGAANRSYWGALPIADEAIVRLATSGVDAFLRIYGAPARD